MMQKQELIRILEEIAPPEGTEDWDNSGFQIRTCRDTVQSVLVALELNREVISDACRESTDLIITHHPLLFHSTRCIDETDGQTGSYVMSLIRQEIDVYSAHLTFDNALHGTNAYLADLLHLEQLHRPASCNEKTPFFIGSWPEPVGFETAVKWIQSALRLPEHTMRQVGDDSMRIRRIGICSGGGGDFVSLASANQCDLFLTGDVRFHEAQYAKAMGMALVDAGHYGTEKFFAENFASQLRKKAGTRLNVKETRANTNPFVV